MYMEKLIELKPHIDMIIKQAKRYKNYTRYKDNLFNVNDQVRRRKSARDLELTKEIYDKLILQILLYELNDEDLLLVFALMHFGEKKYYDVKAKPAKKEEIFRELFEEELNYSLNAKPNRNNIVNYMIKQSSLPQNLEEGLELIDLE